MQQLIFWLYRCFVCALPFLQVGDIILEVNGLVLHNRSHLNASAVIKSLPEAGVTFVVLRKADPMQDLGPRPVSQFPTGLEENPIERYTRYRGLRQVPAPNFAYFISPFGTGLWIRIQNPDPGARK
jgi:hypothetical protein